MHLNDVVEIEQIYARYGHLLDAYDFDGMTAVFTRDCIIDATGLGLGTSTGHPRELRAAVDLAIERDQQPIAHHVTNVSIHGITDTEATVRAKAVAIFPGGRVFTGQYLDSLTKTGDGWRISHRRIWQPGAAAPTLPST